MKDMKHEVKREKLKVPMIILAALAAVFIMMLPSPVMAFYAEAIPDDVAPAGFSLSSSEDYDYSKKAGCFLEMGQKRFTNKGKNHAPAGEWTYQYWDEVVIYIGETDDVNCAMNFIQEYGDKGWGWDSAKELKERIPVILGSERSNPGIKFWEEELFGNNQWHYACECIYHPRNDKLDMVGRGVSTSLWFSGNKFIIVETSSASSHYNKVHDSFREDVFYPTMEEARKITVPSKLSLTEEPAETTPTPPTTTTATAKLTDDFAEVKGDFPALFSDNDDSTYVRGGLDAPNRDYEAKFTMNVQETDTLKFNAKVNCLSGHCGGKTKCGFLFFAKNHETGEYDQFSGAPWDPPGIHEYVLTLEDASKYIRNGEVDFFFSFHCNMDGYVMEFKQMGVAPSYTAPTTGTAKVYVNNEDDDDLDVKLWIGDESKGVKNVPSGASNYHFGDYELSPGDHKFKIEWNDPDTYEWYEDESTATISVGEPTTVTLTAEKHVTVKAVANIINYDDDELEIDLYMEDEYITTKNIPHWGQQVEYITVLPGTYTFKIRWEDPDTWKKYEIENTVTFKPGDIGGRKVNLRVPKHQATTADVYVMNKYSDTLEIVLEIDGKFEDRKIVSPSSSMRFYGSYEVSPDSPIFEMSWDDPDTGEACRVNKEETFEEEDVKQIKLIAEKHGPALEVDVKPYGCVLEEGDKKNIYITIKNTGDSTAESVSGIIESKNTVTAIIGGSKTTDIGDIKPGETWTKTFAVPYIEAKKEGETTVEVKVRSNNARDILKDIQVRVVKPEVLPPGFIPRIEPLPDKLIDEDLKKSSPHTNDFTEMFDVAEEEITDTFLSNGLDAALIVQSSSKAGKAVNGKDVMAFLAIANKKNTPLYVVAKIVPPYQDVFKYYDGKYLIRVQKKLTPMSPVDNEALDYLTIKSSKFSDTFKTVGNWEWQNYKEQIQFYDDGTVFYIEPNHILTIASRMTPEQTGWFDISGDVYYAEQDPESYLKLWKDIVWTPGKNAVKFDLDEMEHVILAKSINVEEKKKCYLGGWICP